VIAATVSPSTIELARALQPVADDAVTLLETGGAAIFVTDGAEARWACDAGLPADDARDAIRTTAISVGVGRIGRALAGGPAWFAGADSPDREIADERWPTSMPPLQAAVPLVERDGQVHGILCLVDRQRHAFDRRARVLVRALAGRAGLAIENAQLARRLADQEARHRFLLDRLPDAIWAAGADRIFTYLSAGIEPLLGYRPEDLIGMSSEIVMHESSRQAFEDGYRWQIAHPDGDQTYRVNLRHRDGRAVPVELHNIGTPVDGRYGGGTGSVREIGERLRLEREIQERTAELAASRERAHLAQELHDSVTQALFSMTLAAGTARMLLERGRPGAEAKLEELSALAQEALAEMRSLIFELRPANIAQEGLVPALRKHAVAIEGRTGLVIHLTADDDLGPLPLVVEEALYRIAQEAIHNVVKHAGAREVSLRLERRAGDIRIEVRDDGAGFDPRRESEGLGLLGMASRAERLGGRFEVRARPGSGTTVCASLPIASCPDPQAAGSRAPS
jgi:PAS domain S-box-containing protein